MGMSSATPRALLGAELEHVGPQVLASRLLASDPVEAEVRGEPAALTLRNDCGHVVALALVADETPRCVPKRKAERPRLGVWRRLVSRIAVASRALARTPGPRLKRSDVGAGGHRRIPVGDAEASRAEAEVFEFVQRGIS